MRGLRWLCDRSSPVLLLASEYVQGYEDRACLELEGIQKAGEQAVDLPVHYCPDGTPPEEPFETEKADWLFQRHESLAGIRDKLPPRVERHFKDLLARLVKALVPVSGTAHRLLQLARLFAADLVEKKSFFQLAVLENMAGDRNSALSYYLQELGTTGNPPAAVLENLEMLWPNTNPDP